MLSSLDFEQLLPQVNSIAYSSEAQTLMSVGEDTSLVLWNMAARRLEVSYFSCFGSILSSLVPFVKQQFNTIGPEL